MESSWDYVASVYCRSNSIVVSVLFWGLKVRVLCKVWWVRSQVRCPKAAFAGHRPLRYDLTHSHRALPFLDAQPITRYLAHADARALVSSTQT